MKTLLIVSLFMLGAGAGSALACSTRMVVLDGNHFWMAGEYAGYSSLGLFIANTDGAIGSCTRPGGLPPVTGQYPQLILSQNPFSLSGSIQFDLLTCPRRVIHTSSTGDLQCSGAVPAPLIDRVFRSGFEPLGPTGDQWDLRTLCEAESRSSEPYLAWLCWPDLLEDV